MKNTSVIPLLDQWEKFIEENPQKDIYAFANWLLASKHDQIRENRAPESEGGIENAVQAAILITRLQRYLGMYVKPAIKALGFTREHEYNFLYQVSKMNNPNKNDLSKENMVEFSTGRDIIRRLILKNLVSEKVDPGDKRAAQLHLTAKGRKILDKSFNMIAETFTDFLGGLSAREQSQLIVLLNKLNKYQALKNNREILSYL
ncbi:MAG TPA: MarR family winged helix-turn-helix transcriptional regulator [Puia sp.]|jgi:DNA-binding MarR family transcriptional regulator|nr:MarR family winged helix-turn-helix transcriptional regulator [Puia sp.]